MSDTRRKDANWSVTASIGGGVEWAGAQLAVLMDLRDELKRLNDLLHCVNFITIPRKLDKIVRNTTKKRRKQK